MIDASAGGDMAMGGDVTTAHGAISQYVVDNLTMPLTPERVWRAMQR